MIDTDDPEFGKVYYYAGPEFQAPETAQQKFVRKFKADPLVGACSRR